VISRKRQHYSQLHFKKYSVNALKMT